ncbi:type II toxin-antitoxin system Phd/YefM family antitoxin [Thiothrix subterranea]|uniref:Antitoxin n=1 Tax=Thiothrix subterranea TaxID=2735563 RepID=A0AA51MQR1_9GAMM|nr:type II toxin-antitoxin system prevent-host-death family antitoxin [Thiothrix subterranea]MDQ5767806.1 type II toxin-antitoxin system prevent-host-death family antitoxin [Thiothrix subterranea]WML86732.1 type II toxin-antitoxin system prevent-host-death family antitoxin [Thiothrix subterranea]
MQSIGARQASNQLGAVLDKVWQGEPFKITRNKRDTAVILSMRDFEMLGGEAFLLRRRAEAMQQERQQLLASLEALRTEAEQSGLTKSVLEAILNDKP